MVPVLFGCGRSKASVATVLEGLTHFSSFENAFSNHVYLK